MIETTTWTRARVARAIAADPGLERLRALAAGRLGDDPGHDLEHALRVALWTLRLSAELDGGIDHREAIAAALLHDIVNLPKDAPNRAEASALAAEVARAELPAAGFDEAATARVAGAIETHSFSRGEPPRTALGEALCDADRLEALGVIGLFRTVSTGARMGARYFEPDDPWAERRPLADTRFTVDHFFRKLLGLHATFHTVAGRAEARRRTAFLAQTLDTLATELGVAPPPDRG